MTSEDRMIALYEAVKNMVKRGVPGDLVECGVWKGGSAMVMAYALMELNSTDRNIFLYDTYEGMVEPEKEDLLASDLSNAHDEWKKHQKSDHNEWCYASLDEVKRNMSLTGYPEEKIFYVKGKVEETVPHITPEKISILRLDTDWYKSTLHELKHLYPLLSEDGTLIIDDYGYWKGAKKAVDEYFENKQIQFNKIDETGIIGIKPQPRSLQAQPLN